jgi:peptidyl-prolyl cis-trans isomerase D
MAIIGRIRKHSGLAVILVGVAIAAFVIGDFGKKRYKGTTDIGSVNGEAIPYADFNSKVEELIQNQKENTKSEKITDEDTYNIRQTTWNNLVKELIMENEFSTLGLTVSSDELFDQVQGKNPHKYILQYFKDPKTGVYDPSLVRNYLRNLDQMEPKAKEQWIRFEKAIKEDRLQTKFDNLIIKAYYMPTAFLHKQFVDQNYTLNIRTVAFQPTVINDADVKLTDADYQKYYDENKSFFWQEQETRDADYVVFEVTPSDLDRKKIQEDVDNLYKDFSTTADIPNFTSANSDKKYDSTFQKKGTLPGLLDSLSFSLPAGSFVKPFEFNSSWYMAKLIASEERPDTMKATQVLISFAGTPLKDESIKRTKEQAKHRADSLFEILKKSPDKMKEFAQKFSDYPTAKEDNGDIKAIVDGDPNFALFFNEGLKMKPNDPKAGMKVIETGLGYSIFKLTYKSKPIKKVRVAILERKIEPSNQTYQDTYLKASAFAGQNTTSEAFDKTVKAKGLAKRNAQNIREMDNYIMGLNSAREIVRWVYAENTKIGEVSPVFDLSGKYVVAILTGITPKGYIPLDKLKDRIKQAVTNDKKLAMITERVKTTMNTTKDLYTIAHEFSSKVDTSVLSFGGFGNSAISRDGTVLGKVFSLKPGVLSGPFTGKYSVYLVIVDKVNEPPKQEDYTAIKSQQTMQFSNRVVNGLFEAIKKTTEIKDMRGRFY